MAGCSLTVGSEIVVLSTPIIVLLILLLGLVTANTLGGLIHIVSVVAIVVVLLRVIQGRSPNRWYNLGAAGRGHRAWRAEVWLQCTGNAVAPSFD
jgi:hypothetical protein